MFDGEVRVSTSAAAFGLALGFVGANGAGGDDEIWRCGTGMIGGALASVAGYGGCAGGGACPNGG